MKKSLVKAIEKLGWIIHDNGEDLELEQSSPLGEDFIFCVSKKNAARDIAEYAANFDEEEHAEMWIEGRGTRGIPSSIRALLDDAADIQIMLDDLAEVVQSVA